MAPSRYVSLVWLVGFASGIVGCGGDDSVRFSHLNAIIGSNDLVQIQGDEQPLQIIQSIGRMDLGCTVTHLGGGVAITAGHCMADGPFEGVKRDLECLDDEYDVEWGVTYGDDDGYLKSDCSRVLLTEFNKERDYALLQMDPAPAAYLPMKIYQPEVGTEISIFSHPRRRPLEWSGTCAIERYFEKEGVAEKNTQIAYQCDTEGGSSGAAVLNSYGEIIGVHNFHNWRDSLNGATVLSKTPVGSYLTSMGIPFRT